MHIRKYFPLLFFLLFFTLIYVLAASMQLPSIPKLGGGEAEITSPTTVTHISWNISCYGGVPKVDGVWITCADLLPSGSEFYVDLFDNLDRAVASGTKILPSDLPADTPTLILTTPQVSSSAIYKISIVISASTSTAKVFFNANGLDTDAAGTVLTVDSVNYGYADLPKTFSWVIGSSHSFSWASPVSAGTDKRYAWVNTTGLSTQQTDTINVPAEGGNIIANYNTQWQVTFTQTGLDPSATGAVVTVNGTNKEFSDLSYSFWADTGSFITFNYSSLVASSTPNKRFALASVAGGTSPITLTNTLTLTGNYNVQWQVTFTHSGLDSSATGTIVTINGNSKSYSDLPFTDWYNSGSLITYSFADPASSSASGKRFDLTSVTGPSSPITVTSSATVTGNYNVQWQVTFTQTGLDSSATGTVVTVDGVNKVYSDLPFSKWVDDGATVTYSYSSPVSSSTAGKRFSLSSVTGPTSPLTVTSPVTVTGNYVVQWLVTFTHTGLDSSATGTVVTVNSVSKTYSDLPYSFWADNGASVTYSYSSTVSSSATGKRFSLSSVTGLLSPITVTSSATVTGNYNVQWQITFTQTGLDSSATGTVVTVDGITKVYADLPFSKWVNEGATVTYSYSSPVSSSTAGKRFSLSSVSGPTSPITVTSAVTVTGNYVVQYRLVITINAYGGDGSGTTSPAPGTYWYNAGTNVQVTATSSGGLNRFSGWYLDGVSKGQTNPYTVTMNAPHTLDAEFIFVEPPEP
jgi:hypothetical protein